MPVNRFSTVFLVIGVMLTVGLICLSCEESTPDSRTTRYRPPTTTTTTTPTPTATTTDNFPRSLSGSAGCREWTSLIDELSNGARTEAKVRPYFIELIRLENVEKVELLYEQYFSKAAESELKERGAAVHVAAWGALEEGVDLAATYLTDACHYYGYESPF